MYLERFETKDIDKGFGEKLIYSNSSKQTNQK